MDSADELRYEPGTVGPLFGPEDVRRTEQMLGTSLDPDYLAHLRAANGGRPVRRLLALRDTIKVVDRVLGLVPNYRDDPGRGRYDLGVVWSAVEDRLNEHLIPFAAVAGGDLLCFDNEAGQPARVVLWDHERSDVDSPVVTPVARSFRVFVAALREEPGGAT